jgi:hypothetical protein
VSSRRRPRANRRGGQALLLAVLLMVFAALLGSTFITVVALNLNQTARQGGLASSRSSATAALTFVNDRLTNSMVGTRWRPWQGSPPPREGQGDFNIYYSPLERAKGWVNTVNFTDVDANDLNVNGITLAQAKAANNTREIEAERFFEVERQMLAGARCFVKFPDPRGAATNAGGPVFLAEVRPDVDPTNTPTGLLKIRVIGQNEDEAGAFEDRTAFKATNNRGGPFSFARFDTNFNYRDRAPARTRITAAVAASATLPVESTVGLESGRTVLLGDDPTTAQTATVLSVTPASTPPTITLTAPVTAVAGTPVAAVSPLMDGLLNTDFDAEGDGSTGGANAWEETLFPVRRAARGVMLNGGAVLQGKSRFILGGLATPRTDDDDFLRVAGLIAPRPGTPVDLAQLATPDPVPTVVSLPDSNDPRTTPLSALVRDNRSKVGRDEVETLTPPTLESNGSPSRYREATQYADPATGSTYGYGPGVYINNTQDVEKKTLAGPPLQHVALPLFESHRLFQRKFLQYPAPPATPPAAGTLEERHLRGWVTPWEFRPRGVLIELQGDDIVFTRDDRSDDVTGGPLENRPDPGKGWRAANGNALSTGANTYRMRLNILTGERFFGMPGAEIGPIAGPAFNGTILAEGNIRIRGYLGSRDLTVVSMNNIFIEGTIVRDPTNPTAPAATARRIALLARRNVVLNPTQMPTHVAGTQDRDVAPGAAMKVLADTAVGATTVAVDYTGATAPPVRVGDIVRIGVDSQWHLVTQVAGTATPINITLATGLGVAVAAADPVRPLRDADLTTQSFTHPVTGVVTNETVYDLAPDSGQAFARDVRLDGVTGAAPNFLSWRHIGQRKPGIDLERDQGLNRGGGNGNPNNSTPNVAGSFHIKENTNASAPEVISGSTTAGQNEKLIYAEDLQVFSNDSTVDLLDVDGSNGREGDAAETLQRLDTRFAAATQTQGNGLALGIKRAWTAIVTATGTAGGFAPDIPARRLAAVGSDAGGGDDILVQPREKYSIPLALSAGWFFQPAWNPSVGSLFPAPILPATKPVPSLQTIGVSGVLDGDDDLRTTRDDFYQSNVAGAGANPGAAPAPVQAPLRWHNATVPTPGSMSAVGPNIASFAHDPDVVPTTNADSLPHYFFAPPKMERDDFSVGAFDAVPMYVQATIFAQEGSWFVITPPLETVPDINNDADVTDPEDIAAATRYRRLNYQIVVTGTIVQNFAPTALTDYDGTVGAMRGWVDALSRPTNIEDNGSGQGRGRDWQAIEYQPDPLPGNTGLDLPPTPDILYTD